MRIEPGTPSQRIRILLTVPHLQSVASPYREMMAIANYLPRPEFDLTICSLREAGQAEAEPILRALGVRVLVARIRPRGRTRQHLVSCLRDQRAIDALGPFDLQHSLDFTPSPIEAAVARTRSRRFVFSQRNLNVDGSDLMLRLKGILAWRVVAISQAVRLKLESVGVSRRKIREIGLGMDLARTADEPLKLPFEGRYVLSVGQIIRLKRHEDAIESFAAVAERVPDLSLAIAGPIFDGSYRESLEARARSRGVEQRVHFLGPRRDVLSLMRNAEGLIHCSESEAFPWVIVEAMSVGTPVIASDAGGIREVVINDRTGILVNIGDRPGFTAALERLMFNPNTRSRLVGEAYSLVQSHYSATGMVSKLADLYRTVKPGAVPTVATTSETG